MKKKNILVAVVAVVVAIICLQTNIIESLLIFILAGAIPGTDFSLPPLAMLALLAGSVIAFTHWVAVRQLYPGSPKVKAGRDKALRRSARKSVRKKSAKRPLTQRRRYSQLEA